MSCRSERLAFPDVAGGKDDLPDGGVVQEVGGDRLHLAPDAGSIPEAPLDWLGDGPSGRHVLDERLDSIRVIGVNEPRDWAAHQLGTVNSEGAPDRRRGVGHDPVAIDEHDGIGAVRGKRPESFLGLPPCPFSQEAAVVAQHEFLADQHHRGQRDRPVQHLDELARDRTLGEHDEDRVARSESGIRQEEEPATQGLRLALRCRAGMRLEIACQGDQERRAQIDDVGPALDVE